MDQFENHPHWNQVQGILEKLREKGYLAWLAGGCVRDYLLRIPPKDFDIVTNAVPDAIMELFTNSLDVGKQFGVVIIPFEGFQIEVATFRSDGPYNDGRHPESIAFSTPQEDAQRRDFTVNALFYDPVAKEIQDFVHGREDLSARVIRAVGDPEKRFAEDKLRMLRAVRFAAQLDFEIDPPTLEAVKKLSSQINQVSVERILYEINRILQTDHRVFGFELLRKSQLLEKVFQGLDISSNWGKTLQLLERSGDLATQWAYLLFYSFNELGPDAEELHAFFRRLKFSTQFEAEVFGLLKFYDFMLEINKTRKGIALGRLFTSYSDRGLFFFKSVQETEGKSLDNYNYAVDLKKEWRELPKPFLTGEHLMRMCLKAGPRYKEILQEAYYLQLEKKLKDVTSALDWAKAQKE